MGTPMPKTRAARRLGPDHSDTPAHHTLASLTVYTLRTTPGLVLITLGTFVTFVLGHPWVGSGLAGLGAAVYAEQCHRTPYADCWRCGGAGYRPPRRHGPTRLILAVIFGGGSHVRRCRACHGHGMRMRWGRRVMNTYRRATHTAPTQPDPATNALPAPEAGPVTYAQVLRAWHDTHPHHHTPRH